jgi:transglutaminase-like putative cysteine protease
MLFRIRHSLHYSYERPVFLEPMTLRLTPRQDASQRLREHGLRVLEVPDGETHILDAEGSDAVVLWFHNEREKLSIEVEMVVETLRKNPFDWIITDEGLTRLPVTYSEMDVASLVSSLSTDVAPTVRAWAQGLSERSNHVTTDFLTCLADEIHDGFHHVGRPYGDPMRAEETLETRTGACRDTALLFMAACQSQGLAARFVSGYSMHHPPEVSEHELHAWAEVYLPGGGWRGYDPSLGLAVADGHVVLAAAPDYRLAAPTSGRYRGTGVGSQMQYKVDLSVQE